MGKTPVKNRAHTFEVGDRVMVTKDLRELDLIDGECGTVTKADGDKYTVQFGERSVKVRGRDMLRC